MKGAKYVGTEEYWKDNVRHKKTLPLECLKCDSSKIINSTILQDALRGILGCPCRMRHFKQLDYDDIQESLRKKADAEIAVTKEIWVRDYGSTRLKTPLNCTRCEGKHNPIMTTQLSSALYSGNLGCPCRGLKLPLSYDEVVKRLAKQNVRLGDSVTKEKWPKMYRGNVTYLPLRCTNPECTNDAVIMTTRLADALNGKLGCTCRTKGYRADRWIEVIKKRVESEFDGIEVKPEYRLHAIVNLAGTFFM